MKNVGLGRVAIEPPLMILDSMTLYSEQGGIAGISRGNCRLFLTNRSFREHYGNTGLILFWLNLNSKAEVDELFAEWKAAQARIISEPEDKPRKLREFTAADLDGHLIRVFYVSGTKCKRITQRAKSRSV